MPYGRMAYDRLAGINFERMREYRLQRTKEVMAKHGIDVLITWDAYSIRYITGGYATVPCRFPQAQMVVLPINGDPHCFLTTSFSCYELRKEMPWLKDKTEVGPQRGRAGDSHVQDRPRHRGARPEERRHRL